MWNRKLILIWLVSGLLGLITFLSFYEHTSPEASVEINYDQVAAVQIAKDFIRREGFDPTVYEHTVIFGTCNSISYLHRTFGVKKTNDLYKSEIPCWSWEVNLYKELDKEGFSVDINPATGDVTYFYHSILDEAEGANIKQLEARTIAENIMIAQGERIEDYALRKNTKNQRKNRTDYQFTWIKQNYELGDATLRIKVSIHGDQLGYYSKYVNIPEKITRAYEKEMVPGFILMMVFGICMLVLFICSIFTLIVQYKHSRVRWRLALWFAIIIIPLTIISFFNQNEHFWSTYVDTMSFNAFYWMGLVSAVIGAVFTGLMIFLFCASGESLSHTLKHKSLPIINGLIQNKLSYQDAFSRIFIGYCLAFFGLGYVTVFYFIATQFFQVWKPLSPDYSNMLGTSMPFLFPLTVAFSAAVSEEFMSRLFTISFIRRYFKHTFIAVLISALIWGFGHSGYAIFPMYVRGIELTIVGILWGYIYLKYGIETVVVAHYVYNAIVVGIPLLRSGNSYFVVSGLIVISLMFLPLLLVPLFKHLPFVFNRLKPARVRSQ